MRFFVKIRGALYANFGQKQLPICDFWAKVERDTLFWGVFGVQWGISIKFASFLKKCLIKNFTTSKTRRPHKVSALYMQFSVKFSPLQYPHQYNPQSLE